ncbi:MBL fold metallo-hydrolase [Sporosarcina sp. D27]|uniref:MBL fold metallo-hydrolase n=1 Tax=Sporosarcina sp. D27 TaxID=1382305 RepID=UPI0004B28F91|nr:MBL fold metallo-hydrolase [Sporosarcina sp. D27]
MDLVQVYEREGVTCVEMRNPLIGKVFAFLTDGMLIDTGPANLEDELARFYENALFDQVVLTHHHEDHTGMAPWIRENRNVPIYIHPLGIGMCSEDSPYPAYRKKTWGLRRSFNALPLNDTIRSETKKWEVIHTPGHAEDQIVLFDNETGTLFSGDLYVSRKTKLIMASESVPRIMTSLRNILTYDVGSMFCCHAGYVHDGKAKLTQKLEYLEDLYAEVEKLHSQGMSPYEIDKTLFPKEYPITPISKGEWDSIHMVTSIVQEFKVVE